jgi:hypothetical protein
MALQWYDLNKVSISCDRGLYITCEDNPKIGYTCEPKKTRSTYGRDSPTIVMLFIPVPNMEHVEAFVLNVLCHFRIPHTVSNKLSEVVNIHWKILQIIVEFCILNQHRFIEQKRCCSKNTIKDIVISKVVLTDLIIHIKTYFNIPFYTPMELDESFSYYLNMVELQKIIIMCNYNCRLL